MGRLDNAEMSILFIITDRNRCSSNLQQRIFKLNNVYIFHCNKINIFTFALQQYQKGKIKNSSTTKKMSSTPNKFPPIPSLQPEPELDYTSIPQSILLHLRTSLPQQYRLPVSITTIDLSTDLDQESLNSILHQLLSSQSQQKPLPALPKFSILINNHLLQQKIKSHLLRYSISVQDRIECEYFIAWKEMELTKQIEGQDWISCIWGVPGLQGDIGAVWGGFGGKIGYVGHGLERGKAKANGVKVGDGFQVGPGIVRAIKCMPSDVQDVYYVICGGNGQEIEVCKFMPESLKKGSKKIAENKLFQIISQTSHQGSINSIDCTPNMDGYFATGGDSGFLNIWQIPQNFLAQDIHSQQKTSKYKKKQLSSKQIPLLSSITPSKLSPILSPPSSSASSWSQISTLCWVYPQTIATACPLTHSISITNITKQKNQHTFLTRDSITSCLSFSGDLLFSSHQDGYVRSWDLREGKIQGEKGKGRGIPVSSYKSHGKFVSFIRNCPHSPIFATGAYDQMVKIWDYRSTIPLQTIPIEMEGEVANGENKIFDGYWLDRERFLVVGAFNKIAVIQCL